MPSECRWYGLNLEGVEAGQHRSFGLGRANGRFHGPSSRSRPFRSRPDNDGMAPEADIEAAFSGA
jgi:hypothetical protein